MESFPINGSRMGIQESDKNRVWSLSDGRFFGYVFLDDIRSVALYIGNSVRYEDAAECLTLNHMEWNSFRKHTSVIDAYVNYRILECSPSFYENFNLMWKPVNLSGVSRRFNLTPVMSSLGCDIIFSVIQDCVENDARSHEFQGIFKSDDFKRMNRIYFAVIDSVFYMNS